MLVLCSFYSLAQGSANSAREHVIFLKGIWPEKKICGPRACKYGPQRKNIFKLIFLVISFIFINFVLSPCIKFQNNLKSLLF